MLALAVSAEENVYLKDVPDYDWHAGCFGTACGNLMGYWDRHGLPEVYTGPTAGGLAPLNSSGANTGIQSMWASKAGLDGRPLDQPGHEDDYWAGYMSADPDPYIAAGRKEHTPDCIGDFIGLNQLKWTNLNDECEGNIDAFVFTFWDKTGAMRWDYTPSLPGGQPIVDLQSGLRAWCAFRGYGAETFTQLAEFNPEIIQPGHGFRFEDLKAEIDSGYPLLVWLQDSRTLSRPAGSLTRANPLLHGMLIYGYYVNDEGTPYARVRTSWASGDSEFREWKLVNWTPSLGVNLPVRGVIGLRPKPWIRSIVRASRRLTICWDGPSSELVDTVLGVTTPRHYYVLERATVLGDPARFVPVAPVSPAREATLADTGTGAAFFRVRVVPPP